MICSVLKSTGIEQCQLHHVYSTGESHRAGRTIVGRTWEREVRWRMVIHLNANIENCGILNKINSGYVVYRPTISCSQHNSSFSNSRGVNSGVDIYCTYIIT